MIELRNRSATTIMAIAITIFSFGSIPAIAAGTSLPRVEPRVAQAAERPPPSIDYQAYVVERFTNSAGGEVLYRRGWWYSDQPDRGFGFDKVYHKHNVGDNQIVGEVVQKPGNVDEVGGGRWVHQGLWQRRQCDVNGDCTVIDQEIVRVVIDYAPWGAGEPPPAGDSWA